ncbi:MAG: hypothetical protein IH945_10785 [Armatimonadetes bacterium]|nr:hypothetical protein [Armatimonadota bacterium]
MTPRERLAAVAKGEQADRKPIVLTPGATDARADAVVVPAASFKRGTGGQAVLAQVLSPFAKAISRGTELTRLLHDDPAAGGDALAELTNETRDEMASALENGADGVYYVLDGAYPARTTPMQYGGYFLEVDRSLLEEVEHDGFNILFVKGDEEPYIDFVSDLPAQAFAWESASVTIEAVREMRQGALAAADPQADVLLLEKYDDALTAYKEVRA